ncbi:hypothetical protein MC7420_6055 [Coleofasciculus chthonoplastes PCC 7420]|uniref:Uncharacterized protein n=1 Tax=Coleofasciculus chthonoplastes PCC 7420 TaxID=118168 RepID=B4VTH6_9CYAN|nr:hypothetical protein MC7420_6055 [Coleofasciculus chthonoplastes PCC 7420]
MKELILHPLVLTLFLSVIFVYFVISFQLISNNSQWAQTVEKFFIVLSVLIISGMNISYIAFTTRFHPSQLYTPELTLPYLLINISFYLFFFINLFPNPCQNKIFCK